MARRKSSALKAWYVNKAKYNDPIDRAKGNLDRLKGDFSKLSTGNIFAKVKNPYANLQTEFENVYEDMVGVDKVGADISTKEFHQNLATTLDKMQEMGMVNVQALANAAQEQQNQTRGVLSQQLRESQILRAQGAEKVQAKEQAAELKIAEGAHTAEMTRLQGAVDARNLEYQKTQGLMAIEAGELEAARANKQASRNWFNRVFG